MFEFDLFISHASEDRESVASVLKNMLVNQSEIWIDSERVSVGDNIKDIITDGIAKSKYVVIVVSNNSLNKDWVKTEYEICRYQECLPQNIGRKFLLPVLHEITIEEASSVFVGLDKRRFLSTENGLQGVANEILHVLKEDMPNIVVGISGPSGSGKTWFAKRLQKVMSNYICHIELDNFYLDVDIVEQLRFRHDNPMAYNYGLARATLNDLKNGKAVNLPVYDFETHSTIRHKKCVPAPIIVLEGLYVYFDKRIKDICDIRLWIDANEGVCYRRRVKRDSEERGRSLEEIFLRYSNDVYPAQMEFLNHLELEAQLKIPNMEDKDDGCDMMLKILEQYLYHLRRNSYLMKDNC